MFANGSPVQTGVIVFGGYAGRAAPHHITLRSITLLPSITGTNDRNDHGSTSRMPWAARTIS